MKKTIIGIITAAAVLLAALVAVCVVLLFGKLKNREKPDSEQTSANGIMEDLEITDEDTANLAAQRAAAAMNLGNAADELTLEQSNTVDNLTYYRFQQNYQGIPVYGATAVVVADESGTFSGFFSNIAPISADISTTLDTNSLKQVVSNHMETPVENISILGNNTVLYGTEVLEMCHLVSAISSDGSYAELIVSVKDKKVVSSVIKLDPVEVTSEDNRTFNGTQNENGEYLLIDQEDQFYILTADDKETLDSNTLEMKENVSTIIRSKKSTFDKKYNNVFYYYDEIKKIEKYYLEKFQEKDIEPFILVIDSGTLTVGGLLPTIISEELQQKFGKQDFGGIIIETDATVAPGLLAHEYTHIVTRNIVHWRTQEKLEDETAAINEAYSDLFSMIYTADQDSFMWDNSRADASNPKRSNYFTKINQGSMVVRSTNFGDKMWVSEPNAAYCYVNAVCLEHAAYLMSRDYTEEGLTIEEIETLWYHTLFTLPSDCTYSTFRDNMEATASNLGFSEEKRACISKAFNKIGVKNSTLQVSVGFELSTYNIDKALCDEYTITVNGYELELLSALNFAPYTKIITVSKAEPVEMMLPEGKYTICVTDGEMTYEVDVIVWLLFKNKTLSFYTEFPGEVPEGNTKTIGYYPAVQGDKLLTKTREYDQSGALIGETTYTYNEKNQLIRIDWTGSDMWQELTYDENGNLLTNSSQPNPYSMSSLPGGGGQMYTYDSAGRLTSKTEWEGGVAEEYYEYDAEGRHTKTKYVYDVMQADAEYTYSKSGQVVKGEKESVYNPDSGNQFVNGTNRYTSTYEYSYDSTGKCISMKLSSSDYYAVREYDYSYKMFVLERNIEGTEGGGATLMLKDKNGVTLDAFGFCEPQFFAEDGYLVKVIDKRQDYFEGEIVTTTEFIYGQTQDGGNGKENGAETNIERELTFEQARELAKNYWNLSDYSTTTSEGTKVAIVGKPEEAVERDGITYYYFRYRALIEDGSTAHWSTWDQVYVNAKTGECSYEITTNRTLSQNEDNQVITITDGSSAEELKKAIVGGWYNPNFVVNNYVFYENGSCKMMFDDSELGTFEITADKTLVIKMPWTTKKLKWDSNCLESLAGWYFTSEGNLIIEGKVLERQ